MLGSENGNRLDRLLEQLRKYIHDILDVPLETEPYEPVSGAPAYLTDRYAMVMAGMLGHRFLLMIPWGGVADTPSAIAKHRDQLRRHVGVDLVVFAAPALSAHDRRRLIAHRVAFIVPGNQMFIPELAMDLREHFKSERTDLSAALTPAAQFLVIAALLGHPMERETPTTLAARYDYSQMSMGRAVDELRAAGLAEVEDTGKFRYISFRAHGLQLWELASPMLRSPVRKRRRIALPPPGFRSLLAGGSALAQLTDLAEPNVEVRAIAANDWKTLAREYGLDRPIAWSEPIIELETWAYNPWILSSDGVVDPLSLWLTLPDGPDERLQLAKDQLLKRAGL